MSQSEPLHAGTLHRLLQSSAYFREVPLDTFREAEGHASLVTTSGKDPILSEGESSPYSWFLIEGEVSLETGDEAPRILNASDADARYPIANLRPARYTVQPRLASKLIRLEQAFLKRIVSQPKPARFIGGNDIGGGSWQSHRFAIEVSKLSQEGELVVPALPGISARVSQAIQDPNFATPDLARLISADPAIAGSLLNISNSPLFRGASKCETLDAAIVRLGVQQVHTLVLSLAAKSLFTARRAWIRSYLQSMWRHAVTVGAFATVLARLSPRFDTAKALLLGLLHEIGAVPILELADKYPELEETPGVLQSVLANLGPKLTASILEQWGLSDFSTAALHQENWYYDHPGEADYTDVLIVAHLHSLIKAKQFAELPRVDETPAFQQLSGLGLSASTSLSVLEEASQEIGELQALLN